MTVSLLKGVEVWIFYFDVVGFKDEFLKSGNQALHRLRRFQLASRRAFEFGHEHSYIVTLFDNVWARVNAIEPGLPSLLFDFAGEVMLAAQREGFDTFFGVITRGKHQFDPRDRMLVAGDSWEDLKEQHIDITSEPHMRAALAEKWSATGAFPKDCIWVSADAVDPETLEAECSYPNSTCEPFGAAFDLAKHPLKGVPWPFTQSRFRSIAVKSGNVASST